MRMGKYTVLQIVYVFIMSFRKLLRINTFQMISSHNFPTDVFPHYYDEDQSSSEDSVTRLLDNSLDWRGHNEMVGVNMKETSLVEYTVHSALDKESRI